MKKENTVNEPTKAMPYDALLGCVKVKTMKLPWKTNHFNEGQRVFVEFMTGNQACKIRGKYRGKHRWVSAWFKWNDKNMHLVKIKEIELSKKDYNAIMGI